jgi:hypothetical protein
MGFPIDGGFGARSAAVNTIRNDIANGTVTQWDVQTAGRILAKAQMDLNRTSMFGDPFTRQRFERRFENAQMLYQQARATLQDEQMGMSPMGNYSAGMPGFVPNVPGDGNFNYGVPNYNYGGLNAGNVLAGIAGAALTYGAYRAMGSMFQNHYNSPNAFRYNHWDNHQNHSWGPHHHHR